MRKFMLGILFFIPLAIVLVVTFTSEFIASRVEIPVSEVEIFFEGDASETQIVKVGQEGELSVRISPSKAANKNVSFHVETPEGSPPLAKISGTKLSFLGRGDMSVFAVTADGGYKAYISFHIVDEDVSGIFVGQPADMEVGETLMLDAHVLPIDALDKNLVFENRSPENVFVDANGIVTAKKPGIARISISSHQFEHITAEIAINIISSNPPKLFQKEQYISKSASLELAGLFAVHDIPAISITGNGKVENGLLQFFEEGKVFITADGYAGSEFVFDPLFSGIKIDQKDILTKSPGGCILFMGGRTLHLTASHIAENDDAPFEWSSSDSEVAVYRDGRVVPKKDGKATITVRSGGAEDSIEIVVVQEILWAQFNYNEISDKKHGIKQEIVFGTECYIGDSFYQQNTVQIEFSAVYPAQDSAQIHSKFKWSSSDETIATVDENGLVRILPFSEKVDKFVTIEATPVYPMYENYPIKASYTFKINSGIDVYDWEGFCVTNSNLKRVTNLHADIILPDRQGDDNWFGTAVYNDLFGNGNTIDSSKAVPAQAESHRAYTLFLIMTSNLTIDNVTLHGCDFQMDESAYGDIKDVERAGTLLLFGNVGSLEKYENIQIKNCIFENALKGIFLERGELAISGCVFRNIAQAGIELSTKQNDNGITYANELYLKDNVFYNCLLFPILVSPQMKANGLDNKITVEGIFKAYNWRTIDQVPFVQLINQIDLLADYFGAIVPVLTTELQNKVVEESRYAKIDDAGNKHYLFGIVEPYVMLRQGDKLTPLIESTYAVTFAKTAPFVRQNIEMQIDVFVIGLNIYTLPGDSTYIELGDFFGQDDREAIRQP